MPDNDTLRCQSPLLIKDGFLVGWVFDSHIRPLVLEVSIDKQLQTTILTGTSLTLDDYVELGKAPEDHCGFAFPLPRIVFDGRQHLITVKVRQWRLPNDPQPADLTFVYGHLFGEVRREGDSYYGLVHFRETRRTIPPVLVFASELDQLPRLQIPLRSIPSAQSQPGVACSASFRVQIEQFSLWDSPPLFVCSGTPLALHDTELHNPRRKLAGKIERISAEEGIRGFAMDLLDLSSTPTLALIVDGHNLSDIRPNVLRHDIGRELQQNITGIHGFHIPLPPLLRDGRKHALSILFRETNQPLEGSGQIVQFPSGGIAVTPGDLGRGCLPEGIEDDDLSSCPPLDCAPPEVSVIICSRNGGSLLDRLLRSWEVYNRTVSAELIVIDHGSSDDTAAILSKWQQRLRIITVSLDYNNSFAASCNHGASLATGNFLLFLNNDIVLTQDILPAMLESLADPGIGIVGIKLLKPKEAVGTCYEVQHLGIRFSLTGGQYWPYEITPDPALAEAEYSAQMTPAVTGAVLLCRKEDFSRAGGFDQRYFYGFEDVEFCLRFTARTGKSVLCRNDLSALHLHGHTRLSGKEPTVFNRLEHNARILSRDMGLWLKQVFRRNLWLDTKEGITKEKPAIGVVVPDNPGLSPEQHLWPRLQPLVRLLQERFPEARVTVLKPDRDWYDVSALHLLLVTSPYYDLRAVRNPRGDLIRVAWLMGDTEQWQAQPWWSSFDFYAAERRSRRGDPATGPIYPVWPIYDSSSLQKLIDRCANQLRIAILVPFMNDQAGKQPDKWRVAIGLQQQLKSAGASVLITPLDEWDNERRVEDVRIYLHGCDIQAGVHYRRRDDCLNIIWILDTPDQLSPATLAQADMVWVACSKATLPGPVGKSAQTVYPLPPKELPSWCFARNSAKPLKISLAQPSSQPPAPSFHPDERQVLCGLLDPPLSVEPPNRRSALPLAGAMVVIVQDEENFRLGYQSVWAWEAHQAGAEVLVQSPTTQSPQLWLPPAQPSGQKILKAITRVMEKKVGHSFLPS